ncbi:MAG: hypothetical protein RL757_2548 [Bacteroidota bacterium]|jgi:peptidoglycan-associated lipoprotein
MMKFKNIVLSAVLVGGSLTAAFAQPVNGSRPEAMLAVAEEKLAAKDFYNAVDWYEKYYNATKDRGVAYQIAQCYMSLHDYAKAETWLVRTLDGQKKMQTDEYPDARFHYSRMLKMNEKYDDAIANFEEYLQTSKNETLKTLAKSELLGAKLGASMREASKPTIENGGNVLNSPSEEYSPALAPDGSLYFVAYRSDEVITLNGKEGDYHAKIFRTKRNEKASKWDEPEALGAEVNRPGVNQGNVAFSRDGNVMYFTRVELDGNNLSQSKIFYSVKAGNQWGAAQEVAGINGEFIAKQPSMGELYGKTVLFFVSNMEGTKGGFDIFYAERKDDGSFAAPVNLGTGINTVGDEETPYYSNGKLYFSSTGHAGIGGFDIFQSAWNGSAWAEPKNMGKPFNSSADDKSYSADADGNGFVVSNRAGGRSLKSKTCCDDIWVISVPPIEATLKVIALEDGKKSSGGVKFRLLESTTKIGENEGADYESPLAREKSYTVIASKEGFYGDTIRFTTVGLAASQMFSKEVKLRAIPPAIPIIVTLMATNKKSYSDLTYTLIDKGSKKTVATGKGAAYNTKLERNVEYMLIGSKDGYISDTVAFNTNGIMATTTITKMVAPRRTIRNSEKIVINNIFYAYNSADITFEEAKRALDYVNEIMVKNPTIVIELGSHTDSRGKDDYNMNLSQRRAESAKQYLLSRGISPDRIVAKGYGETQIINQCQNGVKCSDDEHQQNRRTEFQIIAGPKEIVIEEQGD